MPVGKTCASISKITSNIDLVYRRGMQEVDVVDFVEEYFGIQLFEYQKILLRNIRAKKVPIFYKPLGGLDLRMFEYVCKTLLTKEDFYE